MPRRLGVVLGGPQAAVAPSVNFRLRPGERPTWIELDLPDDVVRGCTHRAASVGVSLDVAFALQLEWALVSADINAERLSGLVVCASELAASDRMAPTPELREWLAYLDADPADVPEHDLPSVALPSRLFARIPPASRSAALERAATALVDEAAVVVERAAAIVGMTMETWVYRTLALAR